MAKNLEITLPIDRQIRVTRPFDVRANWCGARALGACASLAGRPARRDDEHAGVHRGGRQDRP